MKDSWRVDHDDIHPEHTVYERLVRYGVTKIPTCLGGEDVGENTEHLWQRTCIPGDDELEPRQSEDKRPLRCARGHYRLFIKEILRPLTDFKDWRSLLWILDDGMCGEFFIYL